MKNPGVFCGHRVLFRPSLLPLSYVMRCSSIKIKKEQPHQYLNILLEDMSLHMQFFYFSNNSLHFSLTASYMPVQSQFQRSTQVYLE